MGYPGKAKRIARPAASVALRYGLALVSVAAAFGLAHASLYFHLPQQFTALALSAIAIAFWYGGTNGRHSRSFALVACSRLFLRT
jgi:hypothetical protein